MDKNCFKAALLTLALFSSVSRAKSNAAEELWCASVKNSVKATAAMVPVLAGAAVGAAVLAPVGIATTPVAGPGMIPASLFIGAASGAAFELPDGIAASEKIGFEKSCGSLGMAPGHKSELLKQAQALTFAAEDSRPIPSAGPDLRVVTDTLNAKLKKLKVKGKFTSLQVAQAIVIGDRRAKKTAYANEESNQIALATDELSTH